jgi:hypothetical protein
MRYDLTFQIPEFGNVEGALRRRPGSGDHPFILTF